MPAWTSPSRSATWCSSTCCRTKERERAQRAEQARRLLLAQAIRRLHGLGQDAEAIAAALAVDADEVRRVLSG